MPKQEKPTLPVSEKECWSLGDLIEIGVGSRSAIWRLRRDDPTFPKPVVHDKFLAADVRAWLRSRRQPSDNPEPQRRRRSDAPRTTSAAT